VFCLFDVKKTPMFGKNEILDPDPYPQIFQSLDPDPHPKIFQTLDPDSHEMDADPKPSPPSSILCIIRLISLVPLLFRGG